MFVRIKRPTIEKVIECDGYDVKHFDGEEGKPGYITLELRPDRGTFSITKEPGSMVFIMNSDGRTIDRFRWD